MALSVSVYGIPVVAGTQTAGRWATADITTTDGTEYIVYTVPSTVDYVIFSISICNRASVSANGVAIAISPNDVPTDQEYVEWNASLVPNGVLERTQMVANAEDRIIVRVG